jgi:hypothetical protein
LQVHFWGEQGEIKKKCTPDVARYPCLTYIPEYFLVITQKIKGRHRGLPLQ